MGVENYVRNLPEKKKKLFTQLISVFILLDIAYAFLSFARIGDISLGGFTSYIRSIDFICFWLVMIVLWLCWKILSGGKITIPNQPNQQIFKQNKVYQQPKKTIPRGSWECSNCKNYVIGTQCPRCRSEN